MTIRRRWLAAAAAAPALLLSGAAYACVCCADPGHYRLDADASVADRPDVLDRIRFAPTAQLYTTDAGDDAIKGLPEPADRYAVGGALGGTAWRLTFRDRSRSGTLRLDVPPRMTVWQADLHDRRPTGLGPALYKEWRLQGAVAGSGMFAAGLPRPGRYTLVLQGRGNVCDEAEHFSHWRLEVEAPAAAYAFFGRLAKPAPIRAPMPAR